MDTVPTESIWIVNMSSCFKGMQKIGSHEVLGSLGICKVSCLSRKSGIYAYRHFEGFCGKIRI
jgi:hypothetical protein